jgi:hypothetical protein
LSSNRLSPPQKKEEEKDRDKRICSIMAPKYMWKREKQKANRINRILARSAAGLFFFIIIIFTSPVDV